MRQSHAGGQDQAKNIKLALASLCPSIRCFLDVDDLHSIDELEFFVDRADALLVFLSGSMDPTSGVQRSHYFQSANCLREYERAVRLGKPLVIVQETDPRHGHVPMEVSAPSGLR